MCGASNRRESSWEVRVQITSEGDGGEVDIVDSLVLSKVLKVLSTAKVVGHVRVGGVLYNASAGLHHQKMNVPVPMTHRR